jgi:pimeloyl-ACP methyl ester carboxylesterase
MNDDMAMQTASPDAVLGRLEQAAQRFTSPCGEGTMVWRCWGSGPPLVLLHGGAGSWRHWVRNIDSFARTHRVVVPDLPGLGESALPPLPTTLQANAEIICRGIDVVVGTDAGYDLAGFSYGGVIAGDIGLLHGARLRSVTIVGSNRLGLPCTWPDMVRVRHLTGAERAAAHAINLSRLMIADVTKIDDLAVAIQDWNTDRARVTSHNIAANNALVDSLPGLPARVKLNGIYGGSDVSSGSPIAEKAAVLRRLRPDVDLRIIPGAGHWVIYEAADAFNAALADMLRAT